MFKRKRLLIAALLIASITLGGCFFEIVDPQEPEPVEPTTEDPTEEPPEEPGEPEPETPQVIPFSSATISPSILKVNVGDTLQVTATTYPENATESGIKWVSQDERVATIDQNGLITGVKSGTSKISVLGGETNRLLGSRILTVSSVTIPPEDIHIDINNSISKTDIAFNYKDYAKKSAYGKLDFCPSLGSPKLLVIPIWFNDSDEFIADANKETVRKDIERAYFGTNSETGWRSVKSFYEEESSGLLTLTGTVSKWREIDESYKSYAGSGTGSLVKDSVIWYFSQPEYSSDSRFNYDTDADGYLDGVMLIYAAPDYLNLRNNYENLWAYCSWLMPTPNPITPAANVYFWASYDFMYGYGNHALSKTGKSSYGYGSTQYCTIDTHTFIHEMGHVLGLDDYYDYSGQFSPAGGFSMQDHAYGGHDPFSVMAYGWADPYVVSDSIELSIETFQKSRDFIVITPEWNEYNSPFDEYLILELFSPTGLNEFDCEHESGPKATGIRMWHVDARLAAYVNYDTPTITSNVNIDAPWGIITAFNNTYYEEDGNNNGRLSVMGKKYANQNILQLIRNDKKETYQPTSYLSERLLFKTGKYNLLDYAGQFVHGEDGQFNNGLSLDWTIDITLGTSDNDLAAKIKLTKNS